MQETIAVIGAGSVGGMLARAWTHVGHPVVIGAREPAAARTREIVNELGPGVRAATIGEAAHSAPIVVLATPWNETQAALAACGDLAGRILIDCTNPLSDDSTTLVLGHATSGAETIAGWAPGARVCKAFNTVGFTIMADPHLRGGRAAMPVCGDDPEAKAVVLGLAEVVGFEPVDAGPLSEARLLEPMALLWIRLSQVHGLGHDWAFCIARR